VNLPPAFSVRSPRLYFAVLPNYVAEHLPFAASSDTSDLLRSAAHSIFVFICTAKPRRPTSNLPAGGPEQLRLPISLKRLRISAFTHSTDGYFRLTRSTFRARDRRCLSSITPSDAALLSGRCL
jgi:hypothetical protein